MLTPTWAQHVRPHLRWLWYTVSIYKWLGNICSVAMGKRTRIDSRVDYCVPFLKPMWLPKWYSSANKIFAVLRRNRSDPLSRAMGCIGELPAGSRSAGYERFGTGNLAPLAVLVPIPKPATHSKGVSNQHPHCTVYIWMYHVGSQWLAVKICTRNKWILKLQFHNFFAMWLKWCTETTY